MPHSSPDLALHLDQFLSLHTKPGQHLLVAFSGGLDSRVLLQLLVDARPHHGYTLEAIYVHHGLSPNADAWAGFCAMECQKLEVPFDCAHVQVDKQSGLGIEASARQVRYAALHAREADHILLGQHQDDQAETLLLQLLRGAGVKGLSCMAAYDPTRRLLRPLLEISRAEIEAYARQMGLQWIEDESNLDTRYDRNFCRHEIFPVLEQRFPSARSTLARSAAHIAEAVELLDELAAMDAGSVIVNDRLHVGELSKLSGQRARNLLRWWLSMHGLPMPGMQRMHEMLQQLQHASELACIKVHIKDSVYLRRYQGWASLSGEPAIPVEASLSWQGETELQLPANGRLLFRHEQGTGLALSRLQDRPLHIRYRSGGERFKPNARRPTRTLKYLFQEADLAPWLRERLPLLYLEDELVLVPGIGVAASWQAQPGEQGVTVEWQPAELKSRKSC
ncbi:tRNA lysidine(34) synthetase TilS [Methylobacillus sp.]|uniref:tRNA lysidine(34) synthetase TilS n=1 Tax=Methylobacillus sp. TaxID=56818 RepID=UPI002FE2EECD